MKKPDFVYVTYIVSSLEKVFSALIDGEATRKYWHHDNVSDWKVGSTWEHRKSDGEVGKVDVVGRVIESDPPRRLVVSWARPSEGPDSQNRSLVTFELERAGSAVRLSVTHDQLESDPSMESAVSRGWPLVLSNLKSLLETGKAIENLW